MSIAAIHKEDPGDRGTSKGRRTRRANPRFAEDFGEPDWIEFDEPPICGGTDHPYRAPSATGRITFFIRDTPMVRFVLPDGKMSEAFPVQARQRAREAVRPSG